MNASPNYFVRFSSGMWAYCLNGVVSCGADSPSEALLEPAYPNQEKAIKLCKSSFCTKYYYNIDPYQELPELFI